MFSVDVPLRLIKIHRSIRGPNGAFLRDDTLAWLRDLVGSRGDRWEWCMKAGYSDPDTTEIVFKEQDHAILFKLTWGGQGGR